MTLIVPCMKSLPERYYFFINILRYLFGKLLAPLSKELSDSPSIKRTVRKKDWRALTNAVPAFTVIDPVMPIATIFVVSQSTMILYFVIAELKAYDIIGLIKSHR